MSFVCYDDATGARQRGNGTKHVRIVCKRWRTGIRSGEKQVLEEIILLEYTNHADPKDKIAVRQLMMDTVSHAGFVAPPLLVAKALVKVRI